MSTQAQNQTVEFTEEQLEEMLKAKKEAKKKEQAKKKEAYEKRRNTTANNLQLTAKNLHQELAAFKEVCHMAMEAQHEALTDYGTINKKSKGGFSITTEDGQFRIRRRRDTNPDWDERSTKAVELLKDFLGDTVRKAAKKEYEILITFLERNQQGDLEYSKVMHLLQHQDKYSDPRWVEGLSLLRDSYKIHFKGFGYEFQYKDEKGKWQPITLNFSNI